MHPAYSHILCQGWASHSFVVAYYSVKEKLFWKKSVLEDKQETPDVVPNNISQAFEKIITKSLRPNNLYEITRIAPGFFSSYMYVLYFMS